MDEFYKINSKDILGDQWNFSISLNPNHPVYKGHFPQKAVVPGVMQTEMVKHILEAELGQTLRMVEARNIKFLNLMLPEDAGDLNLSMTVNQDEDLSGQDASVKVKAQAMIGEGVFFKISAEYQNA